jgi:cell division septal protein FtsQ
VKLRRRRSILGRSPWPRGVERTEPLKGQVWTRSERALREPDVAWGWRALAGMAAALELVLLVWLWFGPVFAVHRVEVEGARHVTAQEVAAAAGFDGSASVISVDGSAARARLLKLVWIRNATIQARLPGTVVITVSEWEPVAVYHAGASTNRFLLSSQAVVLGPTSPVSGLVDVQGPAGADPRAGDHPLDPQLLTALVNIQRAMPTLVGQDVAGFVFDSCGDLTLIAKKGWKVYFGRVLTPEEFSSLQDKLAALRAIAGKKLVDYSSSDLDYVNLMNPSEPAVGYKSREKHSPAPSPSPSPGASPRPSPTPSPSPNPCR